MLRALADPLRLQLLLALAEEGELCVCKLVALLDEPQPKVSQHLRVLRAAGLVESRKEGIWSHYRLTVPNSEMEEWAHGLLRSLLTLASPVENAAQHPGAAGTSLASPSPVRDHDPSR